MLPSYRNLSVDSLKSTDWFLYDANIGRVRVNIAIFSKLVYYFT